MNFLAAAPSRRGLACRGFDRAAARGPKALRPSSPSRLGSGSRSAAGLAPPGDVRQDIEAGKQLRRTRIMAAPGSVFRTPTTPAHDPRLLVDMATCEKGMQEYARAARYLDQASQARHPGLPRRRPARRTSFTTRSFRSSATCVSRSIPPGAVVTVDDVPIGQAPLSGDVLVDPGEHRLRVTKVGFFEFTTIGRRCGRQPKAARRQARSLQSTKAGCEFTRLRRTLSLSTESPVTGTGTGAWRRVRIR
jgi:hypothetical protein